MEVDASALRENLGTIRASVGPQPGLVPMVKADAYGVGMAAAARVLSAEGIWGLGVATVSEGCALRDLGNAVPVVVFSPAPPGEVESAVEAGLVLTVSHADTLERLTALARAGMEAEFHLEVDTGMGRAGFDWREAAVWGPQAARAHAAGARWTGCFTHLHSADEDPSTVDEQWRRFQEALAALSLPGEGMRIHALNSAGAFCRPEYAGDLVRPGIFLYGGRSGAEAPTPRRVASVRARVVHLKNARPGDTVGYGATHTASGSERWATVSIGYGDGLPRNLSNRGWALVRGRRVPIVGRISMDVTVVDITDVEAVEAGDVVTFIGRDGEAEITVDEVAELAGTISYEILTGFTARIPRVWENVHES